MSFSPHRAPPSANDAPVADEAMIVDLSMSGTVPSVLSGQYARIGEGMIHAVRLTEGRAPSYLTRSIPTDATDLIAFGSSLLALGDGSLAYELGAGLETVRRVDLAGAHRNLTARSRIDSITGELHLLTSATAPSQLHVAVSPGGLTRTIRSIDNAPSTLRQLELTRDHVVLVADGFLGVTDRAGISGMATWFPIDTEARHIAMDHAHGEMVVVHTIGPSLVRWTLHRRPSTVNCAVLDANSQTFATANGRPPGAIRRFLWTVGSDAVHKHDLLAGTRRSHDFGGGRHPGDQVFIADPDRGRTGEDGGWLVGFVHHETRHETEFVVLDADEIERPAVAVARIPYRIPNGAPGTWIPTVQM
jgi:carotenoid cleavage dioxygenase-like enzyme